MGLIKQFFRGIKGALSNVFGFITRRDSRKKRRERLQESVSTVPRSWGKPGDGMTKTATDLPRIKYKRRIPGLKKINRFVAGFWLFMNFVFSQVILGTTGTQAQWIFFFFLGNCYFILKYLWESRREEHEKKKTS